MRKSYLFLLLMLVGLQEMNAQEAAPGTPATGRQRLRFSSINHLGVVAGRNDNGFVLQSINGVQYRTWFLGLGAGIDTYQDLTIPLFAELRKAILDRVQTPFVYVNGGFQLMGVKDVDEKNSNKMLYDPGAYYEAGLGYYIRAGKRNAVSVAFGYCRKEYRKTDAWSSYAYGLNRYAFKVGYKL